MKLERLISNVITGQNSVFKNDEIHIINNEILSKTTFLPKCKETVAYIVSIILLNDKDQVCLIQEAKKSCKGQWYLPAGRVEKNENLIEAAIRETREETGYLIEPLSLCYVEMNSLGLWYRFTFLGLINDGSLKTPDQADSESLQSKWFNISDFENKAFLLQLRSYDIIKPINIALKYYKQYQVNSVSKLSHNQLMNLKDENNLILPSLNGHQHILFTFVLLNKEFSHCLLYKDDNESTSIMPSVLIVPDVYLKMNTHIFNFVLKNVLFPECFKTHQNVFYDYKSILAIDYNGHIDPTDGNSKYGIQIIFLMSVMEKDIKPSDELGLIDSNLDYQWYPFDKNQELRSKFSRPCQFIKLELI